MVLGVLDKDGSSCALRVEFVMLLLGSARGTNAQRLAGAFGAFDGNNDGKLSRVRPMNDASVLPTSCGGSWSCIGYSQLSVWGWEKLQHGQGAMQQESNVNGKQLRWASQL